MAEKTIELTPTWKFAAEGIIRVIATNNTFEKKQTMKDVEYMIRQMAAVADAHVEAVAEAEAIVDKGVAKLIKEKVVFCTTKGAK
tara:strand:+ start:72 stop:326 length:255 start_codon:yes stop_codon:yes gene_type:complete